MSRPIVLKTLKEEQKYPYFFKNENIDNNVYIVQKAHDIGNALYILDIWKREKYNIGDIDRSIDINGSMNEMSYTKYLYSSNTKIVKSEVNGGNDEYKILLYKKDGKIYTSALLKFNQ